MALASTSGARPKPESGLADIKIVQDQQQPSAKHKFYGPVGPQRERREEDKARHDRLRQEFELHQWLDPGAMCLQDL